MTRMNGGQIIVDYLIQEKVPYLFGLLNPGGAGVWELIGLGHKQPAIGGRCEMY
jgi:thiamine pyrophosphate-dependent acetolactate synthase large subunit-like protein